MVSYWGMTKGLREDWETRISTLMGVIIIREVGKIGARDEEEVRISVSIWGESIVEMPKECLIGEDEN